MCATVLTRPLMTTPFVGAAWYQNSNFKPVENAGYRQRPLNRKWVVVTDEHGNRRLRMRWTLAPFFPPSTIDKAAWPRFEPVVGRVLDETPSPQPQVGIS